MSRSPPFSMDAKIESHHMWQTTTLLSLTHHTAEGEFIIPDYTNAESGTVDADSSHHSTILSTRKKATGAGSSHMCTEDCNPVNGEQLQARRDSTYTNELYSYTWRNKCLTIRRENHEQTRHMPLSTFYHYLNHQIVFCDKDGMLMTRSRQHFHKTCWV